MAQSEQIHSANGVMTSSVVDHRGQRHPQRHRATKTHCSITRFSVFQSIPSPSILAREPAEEATNREARLYVVRIAAVFATDQGLGVPQRLSVPVTLVPGGAVGPLARCGLAEGGLQEAVGRMPCPLIRLTDWAATRALIAPPASPFGLPQRRARGVPFV